MRTAAKNASVPVQQPAPRRFNQISDAATDMLALGESGRYEFKRGPGIKPETLAAAANWVALDRTRDAALILIGVDEEPDAATGLVRGSVFGLSDVAKSIDLVNAAVSYTRPIPVGVTIFEEGVATGKPFLRLEVRPTMPPHFEGQGRRQTRENNSTRPLTDEELLGIYLGRESSTFSSRFQEAARELEAGVIVIRDQVDSVLDQLDDKIVTVLHRLVEVADEAVGQAEAAATSAESIMDIDGNVEDLVDGLRALHEKVDTSREGALWTLRERRHKVWMRFILDVPSPESKIAKSMKPRLRAVLSTRLDPDAYVANMLEARYWYERMRDHDSRYPGARRAPMAWWSRAIRDLADRNPDDLLAPQLLELDVPAWLESQPLDGPRRRGRG